MKMEKMLSMTLILAASVACLVGCMMVYGTDPRWLPVHLGSIAIGIGLAVAITWLGWKPIVSSSGGVASLVVALVCLSGLFGFSPHETGTTLRIGNTQLVTPGYFLLPSFVVVMAFVRRYNGDICLAFIASAFCVALPILTTHLGVMRVLMVMACVLVPFSVTRKRMVACCIVLTCLLFVILRPLIIGGRDASYYTDYWRVGYYREGLLATPWFGPYSGTGHFSPMGGVWDDAAAQAFYVLGKWVLPVLAIVILMVAVAVLLASFRKMDGTRRLLIIGGGISVVYPMFACYSRLFCPIRFGFHWFPFVSLGGSAMIASFVTLGIVLAALNEDWRGANAVEASGRIELWSSVLLAGLGAAFVGVCLYRDYNAETTQIVRMMPSPELGHEYDLNGGVRDADGAVWLPYRSVATPGEPNVVSEVHKCKNRLVLCRRWLPSEPPVVKAVCRSLGNGRIVVDCEDLFKRASTVDLSRKEKEADNE